VGKRSSNAFGRPPSGAASRRGAAPARRRSRRAGFRPIEVALRRGVNHLTLAKWRAFLDRRREFDQATRGSIYRLLPGVVEHTFGL
jgi:hypothetical protein